MVQQSYKYVNFCKFWFWAYVLHLADVKNRDFRTPRTGMFFKFMCVLPIKLAIAVFPPEINPLPFQAYFLHSESSILPPICKPKSSQTHPWAQLCFVSYFLSFPGLIWGAFLVPKWVPYAALGALGDPSGSKVEPKGVQGLILTDLGSHFGWFGRLLGIISDHFGRIWGAISVDWGVILVPSEFVLFHLGLFVLYSSPFRPATHASLPYIAALRCSNN